MWLAQLLRLNKNPIKKAISVVVRRMRMNFVYSLLMSKVSLFFLIVSVFLGLQFNAQTEKQLRQDLQSTKDKTTQLQIRLHLIDVIYERDRNQWQKEVEMLVVQRQAYKGFDNQALISLLEAERAKFLGDHQRVSEIFSQRLNAHTFKNPKVAWRKTLIGCSVSKDKKYHYRTLLAQANRGLKHREHTALYLQIAKNFTATFQKD